MSAYVSVMSAVAGGIGIPGRISDHATLPRNLRIWRACRP